MKKPFSFTNILFLYLVTVPTNVISLGAFTEVWLNEFQLSRQTLSLLYLLSTILVFIALVAVKTRYTLRTTLRLLGACCLLVALYPSSITLTLTLILLQWLGQGWLVEICRTLLLQSTKKSFYGTAVGVMESVGTIAIFLCPFLLLSLIHIFNWKIVFSFLGIFYLILSLNFSTYNYTLKDLFRIGIFDGKFLLANTLIYLPVFLASGFFFHLEACCQKFNLSINTLNLCAWQQGIGIVILQIILGRLWKCKVRTAHRFLIALVLSQIFWIYSLFNFNIILYLSMSILGWSLFGILINTIWQFLYPKDLKQNEEKLQASVAFGFLANALGPILFYMLIK